jgi:hypothetical protein
LLPKTSASVPKQCFSARKLDCVALVSAGLVAIAAMKCLEV